MSFIYKVKNNINNKSYVGKTTRKISRRWYEHKWNSINHSMSPVHLAMRKYGIDNFSIEILEECCDEVVNEKEMYYITLFDTYKNGYNATIGGDGGSTRKLGPLTDEHKEKIAKKHRGKKKPSISNSKSPHFKIWSYFDNEGNYFLCDKISKSEWCRKNNVGRDLIKDNVKRKKSVAKGRFAGYKFFNFDYFTGGVVNSFKTTNSVKGK